MTLRNALRQFDSYRRDQMGGLETLLYKLLNNKRSLSSSALSKDEIKHILVIRNNKRIGNMYFMLPFLREVRKQYPQARIDLLLNEPWQGSVFANMGFEAMDYSFFSFKGLSQWISCMKKLRSNQYDLVLLPYASVGDSMMSALMNAKNKVAEFNPRRNVASPHSNKSVNRHAHAALESLDVLTGMGLDVQLPADHTMAFNDAEQAQGMKVVADLRGDHDGITMAYFRGARGDKQLDETTWQGIVNKFDDASNQSIQWVEVLSPDIKQPLKPNIKTFQSKDMRHLAAVLKELDGFICCDTGPLHLADAAGAKCIGLYTHTNIERYGLLGQNCVDVDGLDNLDAEKVLKALNKNN